MIKKLTKTDFTIVKISSIMPESFSMEYNFWKEKIVPMIP